MQRACPLGGLDCKIAGAINDTCDFCGCCVAVCPVDSIDLYEARIEIKPHCID